LFSKQLERTGSRSHKASYRILGQVQRSKLVYKATEEAIFPAHSPTNLTDADPLNRAGHLHTAPATAHDDKEHDTAALA